MMALSLLKARHVVKFGTCFLIFIFPYKSTFCPDPQDQNLLVIPCTRFKAHGDRAFSFTAPNSLNALPFSVHSLNQLCRKSVLRSQCSACFRCCSGSTLWTFVVVL